MVEQYGIRWILVNNWQGKTFKTKTLAANLPNGVLFRVIDRFEEETEEDFAIALAGGILETSIVFVPGIRILADDAPSGEWPAIEEKHDLALDPRFYRPELETIDGDPIETTTLGDAERQFEERYPTIRLDDDDETEADAAAGHFLDPPPSKHSVREAIRIFVRSLRR